MINCAGTGPLLVDCIGAGYHGLGLDRLHGPLGRYLAVDESHQVIFKGKFVYDENPLVRRDQFDNAPIPLAIDRDGRRGGNGQAAQNPAAHGKGVAGAADGGRQRESHRLSALVRGKEAVAVDADLVITLDDGDPHGFLAERSGSAAGCRCGKDNGQKDE